MRGTGSRIALDSSAWLAYFLGASQEVREYIETESTLLLTSVLSLHEVKKKLLRQGGGKDAEKAVAFMKENSVVIGLDAGIAEKAVLDCMEKGLHTIDALIYRTAVENDAVLLTGDRDFRGLKGVMLLE